MTKAELIEKIAKSRDLPPDVTKKCVQQIVDLAFDELGAYFVRSKVTKSQSPRFTFPGFGTFLKKKRPARNGVNPRTLEPMVIDASFTIDFRPGVELRRALNGESPRSGDSARGKDEPESADLLHLPSIEVDDLGDDDAERSNSRRRLRSRDEVELEDLDDEAIDTALFRSSLALPAPPIQRVKAARAPSKKSSGASGA
ncbi:MAG: integration host factor subunit beta [Nannocystis sp.]|nr:integration host factor subunit beta [Nannocystis sp.]